MAKLRQPIRKAASSSSESRSVKVRKTEASTSVQMAMQQMLTAIWRGSPAGTGSAARLVVWLVCMALPWCSFHAEWLPAGMVIRKKSAHRQRVGDAKAHEHRIRHLRWVKIELYEGNVDEAGHER